MDPLDLAGKLVLKGILDPEDAREALKTGADGIVVSNHGGRQLDGAPSTISALPKVADAIGGQKEVLLDSGVRTGQDIFRALALGANACMIGRAVPLRPRRGRAKPASRARSAFSAANSTPR